MQLHLTDGFLKLQNHRAATTFRPQYPSIPSSPIYPISTRVCHFIPWHCCSVGFATANHPCTSPLLCKKRIHHYPLSNTHNHHPLARRRPSTTQQPQTHRRFNHPGSSTFFQQQLPQLLTTSHKAPNPRHHWPNAGQLTCYAIRRLTLLPQVQSLSRC